ncbi:MAG: hypothetical protein H6553_07745 [Chitinophagales bacterium]|nr:hypothetical protein [Chitinophagales bacterium]
MRKFGFLLVMAMLAIVSCKKEQDAILFNFDVSGVNTTNRNLTVNGRNTILETFKMYISNIKLVTTNNDTVTISDYILYDLSEDNDLIHINNSDETYTKLIFSIGLDSIQNSSLPETFPEEHPLSSKQGMYWPMLNYRFLVAEGTYDTLGTGTSYDGAFSLHLGRNILYHTVEYDFPNPTKNNQINIVFNFEKMFQSNAGNLDLKYNFSNHSEPAQMPQAILLMDNFVNGITVNLE